MVILLTSFRLTACFLAACFTVLTFFGEAACGDEPLAWKLTKGETLRYLRVQERPVTNTVAKRDIKSQTDRSTYLTLSIKDVDAKGVASIVMTIARMKIKKTTPRGEVEFDSYDSKPVTGEVQQLATGARILVDSEFTFKLTPQGAIQDFELTAGTKEKFKAVPTLDPKSMQLLVPTVPLPEGAISINQEWTQADKLNIPSVGDLKIDRKYTFLGTKEADGLALPEIGSTMGVDLAQAKSPVANVQIEDWTHSGTYRFDRQRGRLISQKDVGKMTMTIKTQGQKVPSVGETIETVTLLKDGE